MGSDAKVWFGLVWRVFCPNPKPDHWFSSGDLPEPRTEPLVQVQIGSVQVQRGSEPRTEPEKDNKRLFLHNHTKCAKVHQYNLKKAINSSSNGH
jgi:hypothetical protein